MRLYSTAYCFIATAVVWLNGGYIWAYHFYSVAFNMAHHFHCWPNDWAAYQLLQQNESQFYSKFSSISLFRLYNRNSSLDIWIQIQQKGLWEKNFFFFWHTLSSTILKYRGNKHSLPWFLIFYAFFNLFDELTSSLHAIFIFKKSPKKHFYKVDDIIFLERA